MRGASMSACAWASSRESRTPTWTITGRTSSDVPCSRDRAGPLGIVHISCLFIINEHDIILNMARLDVPPDLDPYRPILHKWMPKAEIRLAGKALARFDGLVTWKAEGRSVRYLVEE